MVRARLLSHVSVVSLEHGLVKHAKKLWQLECKTIERTGNGMIEMKRNRNEKRDVSRGSKSGGRKAVNR